MTLKEIKLNIMSLRYAIHVISFNIICKLDTFCSAATLFLLKQSKLRILPKLAKFIKEALKVRKNTLHIMTVSKKNLE